jgi:hypothetical protein
VFSYVLGTAGFADEDIEVLKHDHRVSTIATLLRVGETGFVGLSEMPVGVLVNLKAVLKWTMWYRSMHEGELTKSLEEWEHEFAEDFDNVFWEIIIIEV